MHRFASAVATLLILGFSQAQELSCPSSKVNIDPCLSPSPGGLFVFRQRFEPDVGGDSGSWGIDGLEILTYVQMSECYEELIITLRQL